MNYESQKEERKRLGLSHKQYSKFCRKRRLDAMTPDERSLFLKKQEEANQNRINKEKRKSEILKKQMEEAFQEVFGRIFVFK